MHRFSKRVLELARVHQRRPQVAGLDQQLHGDLRPDGAPDQLLHAVDEAVHVGGLGIERLPAREGQQPVRQRRRPLGRTLGGLDVAVHVLDPALGDAGLQQLQAAGHAGQQVVEVVRQPAGELAHRLHLLALPQLLLGVHQLGRALGNTLLQRLGQGTKLGRDAIPLRFHGTPLFHVDQHAGEALRRAVRGVVDAPVRLDPVVTAVCPAHPILVRVAATLRDGLIEGGGQACLIVGVHGRDDLSQRDALVAKRRIKAEGTGEGLVHREAVGGQVPVPGADDRPGCQGKLDALDVVACERLAGA